MKNFILILFLFLSCLTHAQMTGSFQLNIDFDEVDYDFERIIYFHVPEDYDPQEAYPLVFGFRGGPHSNAGQFRDQLQFFSDSIGAIVVCPENIEHFNVEEGLVKQLFRYTLDTIQTLYNIDDEQIYLTGLSFGGRHAVIVAMDEDAGEIPSIRGVIPFAAGRNSQLQPDYERIDDFAPACICIGLLDAQVFRDVSQEIHEALIENNGVSLLNEISGVGHTTAFSEFPREMMECIDFIEASYPTNTRQDAVLQKEMIVYPNPSRAYFEFELPEDISIKHIKLMDQAGRAVLHIPIHQRMVNTNPLASGFYTLVVITENGSMTHPLRVE